MPSLVDPDGSAVLVQEDVEQRLAETVRLFERSAVTACSGLLD